MTRHGSIRCLNLWNDQRGSVLATVLLVIVVVLTVILSVMTYALSRYGHHRREQAQLVALNLADAAVERYKHDVMNTGELPDSVKWPSPVGGTMRCVSRPWGPYRLLESTGTVGAASVTRLNLLGSASPSALTNAIVTSDQAQPIVVSGRIYVRGDILTGPQGVIRGRYQGERAPDESFHSGLVRISGDVETPVVDSALLDEYLDDARRRARVADVLFSTTRVLTGEADTLLKHVACIRSEAGLYLDGVTWASTHGIVSIDAKSHVAVRGTTRLSGAVEFLCDRSIKITDSAAVDMAVFWARDSIVIGGDAVFSGIAISPGRIVVKDRATLRYPALLLSHQAAFPDLPLIKLRSSRPCEATLASIASDVGAATDPPRIYVDTSATLAGVILSDGVVDLRGSVFGTVTTRRFEFTELPATYTNWLRNAIVDRHRLEHWPEIPILSGESGDLRVITSWEATL